MSYNEEFLKGVKKRSSKRKSTRDVLISMLDMEYQEVKNLIIEDSLIQNKTFENVFFSNCKFKGCEFNRTHFDNCIFSRCSFESCEIYNLHFPVTEFKGCSFIELKVFGGSFIDSIFDNVSFVKSTFNTVDFALADFSAVTVQDCNLNGVAIISLPSFPLTIELNISGSSIFNSRFIDIDFTHCHLERCRVEKSVFANVIFGEKTFGANIIGKEKHYSSVDLQTLRNSAEIPTKILENVFGIHAPDIQSYAREMLSKIEFHTVFISYSFKDTGFAELIYDTLLSKGVFAFLWKHDAPGGQRLKKIMYDRIQSFDKILFIASKNSLKSEACHFELSEGKKKYESTWEEVLFPIHIDDYLFQIQKHEIPRVHRDLFYDNILELREIHSKDFSNFTTASLNNPDFDKSINNLITDLRKKR